MQQVIGTDSSTSDANTPPSTTLTTVVQLHCHHYPLKPQDHCNHQICCHNCSHLFANQASRHYLVDLPDSGHHLSNQYFQLRSP